MRKSRSYLQSLVVTSGSGLTRSSVFALQRRCTHEGQQQCHRGSTTDNRPYAKRARTECSLYPTPRFCVSLLLALANATPTESSTTNLQSASQAHDMLNLFISTSKQLVTALEQTDWLDRVLIISALIFFGLVVLFVLKQRILDRGLRIVFWWTRFVPGIGDSCGRATGETLKEAVVDKGAGTSLTSAVFTATAVSSTLASTLAATATLSGYAGDITQCVPSPSVVSESETVVGSGSTLVSEPTHVEL